MWVAACRRGEKGELLDLISRLVQLALHHQDLALELVDTAHQLPFPAFGVGELHGGRAERVYIPGRAAHARVVEAVFLQPPAFPLWIDRVELASQHSKIGNRPAGTRETPVSQRRTRRSVTSHASATVRVEP